MLRLAERPVPGPAAGQVLIRRPGQRVDVPWLRGERPVRSVANLTRLDTSVDRAMIDSRQ